MIDSQHPDLRSRACCFKWYVHIHNLINLKLEKCLISEAEVAQRFRLRYGDMTDCMDSNPSDESQKEENGNHHHLHFIIIVLLFVILLMIGKRFSRSNRKGQVKENEDVVEKEGTQSNTENSRPRLEYHWHFFGVIVLLFSILLCVASPRQYKIKVSKPKHSVR